jgi:hypothetical protein
VERKKAKEQKGGLVLCQHFKILMASRLEAFYYNRSMKYNSSRNNEPNRKEAKPAPTGEHAPNISRIIRADSPMYLSTIADETTFKKLASILLATARARRVLPVPAPRRNES